MTPFHKSGHIFFIILMHLECQKCSTKIRKRVIDIKEVVSFLGILVCQALVDICMHLTSRFHGNAVSAFNLLVKVKPKCLKTPLWS